MQKYGLLVVVISVCLVIGTITGLIFHLLGAGTLISLFFAALATVGVFIIWIALIASSISEENDPLPPSGV